METLRVHTTRTPGVYKYQPWHGTHRLLAKQAGNLWAQLVGWCLLTIVIVSGQIRTQITFFMRNGFSRIPRKDQLRIALSNYITTISPSIIPTLKNKEFPELSRTQDLLQVTLPPSA